tara:strand:+ start:244 stop:543 length:300 start_codon:yes stop_codon:yes gene_type:complete
MANTKQKVLDLAKELNVGVDHDGSGSDFEVTLTAPDGHHFDGQPVHQIVISSWDGETSTGIWKMALEDLKDLLPEPCCEATPCDDWEDCESNPNNREVT